MRKAVVAGLAAAAVAGSAFAFAPAVWSQTKPRNDNRERHVVMLDGRGSSIGVSIRDVSADEIAKTKLERPGGVLIEDVEEGSPADKAGLQKGDVVVEFDGERVRSARHFARLVQETPDGRAVKTTIVRDGGRQIVDITPSRDAARWSRDMMHLPELADDIHREVERGWRSLPRDFAFDLKWEGEFPKVQVWPRGRLGAELTPLTDQLAQYFGAKSGVLVASVDADSAAAKAGLKAGDVITAVNGAAVDSPRDIAEGLRSVEADTVDITVMRDKKTLTLKAEVPERKPSVRRTVRPV